MVVDVEAARHRRGAMIVFRVDGCLRGSKFSVFRDVIDDPVDERSLGSDFRGKGGAGGCTARSGATPDRKDL